MTEEEWLTCEDPREMLKSVTAESKRKYRLAACACCRRVWHIFRDPPSQRIVELVERVADDEGLEVRLPGAWDEVRRRFGQFAPAHPVPEWAAALTLCVMPDNLPQVVWHAVSPGDATTERLLQCALLRDIFGNPFRPVAFVPRWRTDTAVAIARGMYEGRDFDAMPILADALQDAGCDSADVLNHCRSEGVHVRGCWVCDLVLGKS